LESLEELGLDGNPHLSHLPRNIVKLERLRYISVCKCNLTFLPGLPFHSLLHNHSDEDFESSHKGHFRLLFDSNTKLTHVPYWIIQHIGSPMDCFGCSCENEDNMNNHSSTKYSIEAGVNVKLRNRIYSLKLDPDIHVIRKEAESVPVSLLEQCLRENEKLQRQDLSDQLPSFLEEVLHEGPTSSCFWCAKAIFIEAWLLTFAINSPSEERQIIIEKGDDGIQLCTLFFCGINCFRKFRFVSSSNRFISGLDHLKRILNNEIEWKIG
jgi:hypothetical protein